MSVSNRRYKTSNEKALEALENALKGTDMHPETRKLFIKNASNIQELSSMNMITLAATYEYLVKSNTLFIEEGTQEYFDINAWNIIKNKIIPFVSTSLEPDTEEAIKTTLVRYIGRIRKSQNRVLY